MTVEPWENLPAEKAEPFRALYRSLKESHSFHSAQGVRLEMAVRALGEIAAWDFGSYAPSNDEAAMVDVAQVALADIACDIGLEFE